MKNSNFHTIFHVKLDVQPWAHTPLESIALGVPPLPPTSVASAPTSSRTTCGPPRPTAHRAPQQGRTRNVRLVRPGQALSRGPQADPGTHRRAETGKFE